MLPQVICEQEIRPKRHGNIIVARCVYVLTLTPSPGLLWLHTRDTRWRIKNYNVVLCLSQKSSNGLQLIVFRSVSFVQRIMLISEKHREIRSKCSPAAAKLVPCTVQQETAGELLLELCGQASFLFLWCSIFNSRLLPWKWSMNVWVHRVTDRNWNGSLSYSAI